MPEEATSSVSVSPSGLSAVDAESSIDLLAVLQTINRGRKAILFMSLGGFALATAIAFLLPLQYTSTVSFIPPSTSSGNTVATALAGQLSALGAGDLMGGVKNSGELYAAILKSRTIASALVRRFGLMEIYKVKKESQAEKALESATLVAVDAKSSIISVSVTTNDPGLAQRIADGYMDALRETQGRLALGQSSQRRLFFGQQLAREKNDLEDAEVDLKKTEEQSGLIAPASQTESGIKTIAEIQAQISLRQVELAAMRESATDQNPEVIRLQSETTDLQAQLQHLQSGGRGTGALIPTSKVPEVQLNYVRKEREVKYHEALFDMLSKQYEAAHLDEAHDAPVIQVLDTASYPDTKSAPRRSYFMFGGLILGALAGLSLIMARDVTYRLRTSVVTSKSI